MIKGYCLKFSKINHCTLDTCATAGVTAGGGAFCFNFCCGFCCCCRLSWILNSGTGNVVPILIFVTDFFLSTTSLLSGGCNCWTTDGLMYSVCWL